MPTKTLLTPRYCCHKPTDRAYVRLNGRAVYLGRWLSPESEVEYDRVLAEWLAHGRRPPDTPSDLTVNEVLAAYLPHVESYYMKDGKPTSERALIALALKPVRQLYGDIPAAGFKPSALLAVQQTYIDAGYVRIQVNGHVKRIRRMFRWAVERELVPADVLHGLQAVSGLRRGRSEARESEPIRPVHDAHVDAIRPHVARQVWAMIELQRLTGMRSGEVTIMRGCDIDTTGRVWFYRPSSHKTEHHGHERVVELGPRAQDIIRPFLKPDLAAFLFSPADAESERRAARTAERKTPPGQGNTVGTNRKRKPRKSPGPRYDVDSYRRAIAEACIKADVPHWHPHQLRHSFATRIRKQYGLETARVMCGHKSMAITETYAEIDRTKAAEIALKIG
ncbi:MAG: site-specific integrase [Planctomycetota bacterium]